MAAPRNASTPTRQKPTVYLSFDKGDAPDDLDELTVDEDCLVLLRGKVCMVAKDQDGSRLCVEYTDCEIVCDTKPKSMQAAIEAAKRGKA